VSDPGPPLDWLAAANRLALLASQLSNVIHEVNNILQIIGGNAELLAMSGLPPAAAPRVRAITDQTERASALLADLLTFSRDVGTATERVDMRAIVDRALRLRRVSLSRGRIESAVEGEGEYAVAGNRQQLLQTILIVLINAEQSLAGSTDGRIAVQLVAEADVVRVFVTDTGSGAPSAAARPTPLEWNAEAPLRLGIGLAVARYLMERQNGSIELRPASPQGTTAVLTLPRWRA
jgi:two-component system NtrC family sensor kinase